MSIQSETHDAGQLVFSVTFCCPLTPHFVQTSETREEEKRRIMASLESSWSERGMLFLPQKCQHNHHTSSSTLARRSRGWSDRGCPASLELLSSSSRVRHDSSSRHSHLLPCLLPPLRAVPLHNHVCIKRGRRRGASFDSSARAREERVMISSYKPQANTLHQSEDQRRNRQERRWKKRGTRREANLGVKLRRTTKTDWRIGHTRCRGERSLWI